MKKKSVQIIFPLLMTVLCCGIMILCLIQPSEKLHAYMHTAFAGNFTENQDTDIPDDTDNSAESEVSEDEAAVSTESENEITTYDESSYDENTISVPESGSQCAVLECTAADIYVPVYFGGGSELLEKGACLNPASALIGASGNSVISAHFNTFFRNLSDIKLGDTVTIYTSYGKFTYEAEEYITFNEDDESYIGITEDDRLTLYTCKAELLGTSSERIGVICRMKAGE